MSARFWTVFRRDLATNARRPLFWIWILLLALLAFGLSQGGVRISSGEAEVGGSKAWISSEYGMAFVLAMLIPFTYGFFVAVAAGMAVIQDEEHGIGELLHSTPLTPSEYVWGKFAAALTCFVAVLSLHIGSTMLFQHAQTDAAAREFIGPFALVNYLRPAVVFALPAIVLLAGVTFAIGTWTRHPILVFSFPLVVLLGCAFFLWQWSPPHLDPRVNFALQMLDPFGWRWLNENYVKGDRGVEFYNTTPIQVSIPFALQRVVIVAIGLGAVVFARKRFERRLRASWRPRAAAASAVASDPVSVARGTSASSLASLGARRARMGFVRGFVQCARIELRELFLQPGLWIFVPLIVIESIGTALVQHDPFGAEPLLTSGMIATRMAGILTTLLCLLLLFYTVESLRREESTRVGALVHASPVSSLAIVSGKALANALVAIGTLGLALGAAWLAAWYGNSTAGKSVPFELEPFALVWGACLVPTFVAWAGFVAVLYTLTRNRYTTYALALAALFWTGYELIVGETSWVTNWPLWTSLVWTDMGRFELIERELLLNRALVISLAILFVFLAIRHHPRRESDAARILVRLQPRNLARSTIRLAPFLLPPLAIGLVLHYLVAAGFQGERSEKAQKDYWRRNVATWTGSRPPDISRAEVEIDIEPERRHFHARGHYDLVNREETAMRQIALTRGAFWEDVRWTLDGESFEPEDRSGLIVFTPATPLAPGASTTVGFEHSATFPHGATKNGGGTGEFILPSGVVLTSFGTSFVPSVGYQERIGVDEDNEYDAKEWPDDHWGGRTRSAFGSGAPYPVRVTIRGPAEYGWNSVGRLVEDTVADGRRTCVWETDHPVSFFNVIGARWDVRRGEGTAIYHHPTHRYNLDEIAEALDASRRRYSEWFRPFPWEELKLSEFPAAATYAQGFATNITFSEGIGFLTKSTPEANEAFLVTAHEAAHQWWGNMLVPGEGPGGNVLSEGMAHFSTILLFEAERGLEQRIHFCRMIEKRYGDERQRDAERSLVKLDGSRPGDTTVLYDKGGFVFWMLLQHMGRETCLAGLRSFLEAWCESGDHALLEDFLTHMRPFAPDAEAYDAFTRQWFHEVVVPRYELSGVTRTRAEGTAEPAWEVRLRVTNRGTSTMPVEVAATRGVRFPEASESEPAGTDGDEIATPESELYQEARARTTLGPDGSAELVIGCDFEPTEVVVDPDALVLQLERKSAVHHF